jgi:predicted O-methyltransferase YrrM
MFTLNLTQKLNESLTILYPKNTEEVMKCVEIGSFEGKGSILIHNKLCKNKDSVLYCIDPFDNEYVKNNKKMAFWNHACNGQYKRFKYNTHNIPKIKEMRGYSDNMIPLLDDNSIDFCYIDGDHSPEQVYKDIINMFKKMKNKGIVLFDDYLWEVNDVVTKKGIDKFLLEYKDHCELLIKDYQLAIRIIK